MGQPEGGRVGTGKAGMTRVTGEPLRAPLRGSPSGTLMSQVVIWPTRSRPSPSGLPLVLGPPYICLYLRAIMLATTMPTAGRSFRGRAGVFFRHRPHLRKPHPGAVHTQVRAGLPRQPLRVRACACVPVAALRDYCCGVWVTSCAEDDGCGARRESRGRMEWVL